MAPTCAISCPKPIRPEAPRELQSSGVKWDICIPTRERGNEGATRGGTRNRCMWTCTLPAQTPPHGRRGALYRRRPRLHPAGFAGALQARRLGHAAHSRPNRHRTAGAARCTAGVHACIRLGLLARCRRDASGTLRTPGPTATARQARRAVPQASTPASGWVCWRVAGETPRARCALRVSGNTSAVNTHHIPRRVGTGVSARAPGEARDDAPLIRSPAACRLRSRARRRCPPPPLRNSGWPRRCRRAR